LFSFPHTQTPSFRPKAAHLPPQRRNLLLLLPLLVFLPPHSNPVISTEGGAFAAAVEKSAVAFSNRWQIHFGSGSGSTVLIPGKIVEVALNFR
jgi:hypothetical protein